MAVVLQMVIFLVVFLQSNTLAQKPIKIVDICFGEKDLSPRYDEKIDKFNDENLKDVLTKKAKKKATRGRNIEDTVGYGSCASQLEA